MKGSRINWFKYAAAPRFYPLAGKAVPLFGAIGALLALVVAAAVLPASAQGPVAGEAVVNCGIYALEPEVFEHFPPSAPVDWARVGPAAPIGPDPAALAQAVRRLVAASGASR